MSARPSTAGPWVAVALCVLCPAATAAEVRSLDVTHRQGAYRVQAVTVLAAPVERVRAIVTDYAHLDRLSPRITESALVARHDDGGVTHRVRLEACVLIFCFDLILTERVQVLANGDIETRVVPEESDFSEGRALWRVAPDGHGHTLLTLDATLRPSFWVPPLLGPLIIRHKLAREVRTTLATVEALAAGEANH